MLTNVSNPRSAVIRKEEFKATLIKKGASVGANARTFVVIHWGDIVLLALALWY